MRVIGLATLLILIASVGAGRFLAQTAGFDVASIKPNVTLGDGAINGSLNGRFTATNASLRALILRAWEYSTLPLYRIRGSFAESP